MSRMKPVVGALCVLDRGRAAAAAPVWENPSRFACLESKASIGMGHAERLSAGVPAERPQGRTQASDSSPGANRAVRPARGSMLCWAQPGRPSLPSYGRLVCFRPTTTQRGKPKGQDGPDPRRSWRACPPLSVRVFPVVRNCERLVLLHHRGPGCMREPRPCRQTRRRRAAPGAAASGAPRRRAATRAPRRGQSASAATQAEGTAGLRLAPPGPSACSN